MYSRIICAIGLGPREKAEHMLRRASELIDSDGEITAVHVAETVPHYIGPSAPTADDLGWMSDVEDKLKSLCAGLDIEASYVVKVGRVAPTILDVARERNARSRSRFRPLRRRAAKRHEAETEARFQPRRAPGRAAAK